MPTIPKDIHVEDPKIVFEAKDLNLWYKNGKTHALKNISMRIPAKNVCSLIGPSGCGKSTFLRTLNRMNDLIDGIKIDGSIKFQDEFELISPKRKFWERLRPNRGLNMNVKTIDVLELRTRVGMVFQKPNPFAMSIFDNVAFGPRSSGIRERKKLTKIVESALKDAALWDEVKTILHDSALGLSGGQQQRLCIARAIAMQPEVLLMDEPTSALDPIATTKIEALIQKLKQKYTIVIVTHSMQQAARISDMTAFFYMGELIEMDTTRKIFTHPKQRLTSDYITGKMG